ncbi:hypothetical protein D1872_320530 [compost metagenome]
MLSRDNCFIPSNRNEEVTLLGSLYHRHDMEAVHMRLYSLDRIYFRHNYIGSKSLGTHRYSLTAPAVAYNDYRLASND